METREQKLETRDKSWKHERAKVGNIGEQKFGGNYPQPIMKFKIKSKSFPDTPNGLRNLL